VVLSKKSLTAASTGFPRCQQSILSAVLQQKKHKTHHKTCISPKSRKKGIKCAAFHLQSHCKMNIVSYFCAFFSARLTAKEQDDILAASIVTQSSV
jgi:hypothetical protein